MPTRQKHCHGIAITRKRMNKEGKMRLLVGLSVGLLVGLSIGALFPSPTWAYSAGNHDVATKPALQGRVSPDAMEAIMSADKAVDDHDRTYDPREHFDRDPTQTSDNCFRNSVLRVQQLQADAIALIKACNNETALRKIGEALHAIQDFYAHSNYVDLSDEDQTTLREAFKNADVGKMTLPSNLRLAGYNGKWKWYDPDAYNPSIARTLIPNFREETNPTTPYGEGDGTAPYDHGLAIGKHKDNSWSGDGPRQITRDGKTKTAFDWSMDAAQAASTLFIDQIIAAVGKDLWDKKFLHYSFPVAPPILPSVPRPNKYPQTYPHTLPHIFPPQANAFNRTGVFGLVDYSGGILDDGERTAIFTYSGTLSTPTWFYILDSSLDLNFPVYGLPAGVKVFKIREFWPNDVDFQNPITISMMYTASEVQGLKETSLKIYEFNLYNGTQWSEVPNSSVDTMLRIVTFETTHFTIYGIGGEYSSVGGIVTPTDKATLLIPYVGLASTLLVATVATAICIRRVKQRKDKR